MEKKISELKKSIVAAELRMDWIQEELTKKNTEIAFQRWVDELEHFILSTKDLVEDLEEMI